MSGENHPQDFHHELTSDTLLVDVPWHLMGSLIGLGRTKQFIPYSHISMVRRAFTKLLNDAMESPQDPLPQKRLATFAIVIGADSGKKVRENLSEKCHLISNNQWPFKLGDFAGRMGKVDPEKEVRSAAIVSEEAVYRRRKKSVDALFGLGEVSKSWNCLVNDAKTACPGDDTFELLQSKHPKRPDADRTMDSAMEISEAAEVQVQALPVITALDVAALIKKSAKAVSPGVDGLSMDVLKSLARCNDRAEFTHETQSFLTALAKFIQRVFVKPENAFAEYASFSNGGEIIGLIKDQQIKVRPISKVNVIRKLSDSFLLAAEDKHIKSVFGTENLAVGTQFGTDKMLHSIRMFRQSHPDLDYSSSDAVNAFNTVSRQAVTKQLIESLPSLYSALKPRLDAKQQVWYHGRVTGPSPISAETGCQQGGPTSPLEHAAGNLTFNRRLKGLNSDGLLSVYADDVKVCGKTSDVLAVIQCQLSEGPTIGLHLHMSTSPDSKHLILLGRAGSEEKAHDNQQVYLANLPIDGNRVRIHPADIANLEERKAAELLYGEVVMGIPEGHNAFVRAHIRSVVIPKLQLDFKLLKERCADDPQKQLIFLKKVLTNKLTHYLRGLPPLQAAPLVDEFERLQRDALCAICGVPEMSDLSFDLARTSSGIGLMTAADLGDPAYVASVIASRAVIEEAAPGIFDRYAEGFMDDGSLPVPALREFEEAVERLRTYSPDLTINSLLHTPAKGLRKLQAKLAAPKAKYRQAEVELRVIAEGAMAHAIYLSGSTKEAGAWVEAMPKTAALTMSATVFACAARNRLLIPHPFILAGTTCPCRSKVIDVYGVHAQKCPLSNTLSIQTHDGIRQTVGQFHRHMGHNVKEELPDVLRQHLPLDRRKPSDLGILCAGKPLHVMDVRITNAVTIELERGTVLSARAGQQAAKNERDKHQKYDAAIAKNSLHFTPVVFEAQGCMGSEFKTHFYNTISKRSEETGAPRAMYECYWTRRLSVALQKGVCGEIITRAYKLAAGVPVTEATADECQYTDVVRDQSESFVRGCLGCRTDD